MSERDSVCCDCRMSERDPIGWLAQMSELFEQRRQKTKERALLAAQKMALRANAMAKKIMPPSASSSISATQDLMGASWLGPGWDAWPTARVNTQWPSAPPCNPSVDLDAADRELAKAVAGKACPRIPSYRMRLA